MVIVSPSHSNSSLHSVVVASPFFMSAHNNNNNKGNMIVRKINHSALFKGDLKYNKPTMAELAKDLSILLFALYHIEATTYCDDELECVGSTSCPIVDTTAYCRGYFGCFSCDLDLSISAACGGSSACWSDEIQATNSLCRGYQGCIWTEIYPEDKDYTSTSKTWCTGYYGCQNAEIYDEYIYCNGAYGCYNAVIDSVGYDEITVEINGYHSGDDLSILCRSSTTTCNIICNGESNGNSCGDTTVTCYGGFGQCVKTCNTPNCPTIRLIVLPPKEEQAQVDAIKKERKELMQTNENDMMDMLHVHVDHDLIENKDYIDIEFIKSHAIQVMVVSFIIILFGLYFIGNLCLNKKEYTEI